MSDPMRVHPVRQGAIALITAATFASTAGVAHAAPTPSTGETSPLDLTTALSKGCPALVAVGVDGAGTTTGTGASTVALGGLAKQATTIGVPVVTALVPLAVGAASDGDYGQLISVGQTALTKVAQQALGQCPAAQLAFTANGQGAQMLSTFLQAIGAGDSPIPADKVSAAAMFGAPDRAAGSGIFPGTSKSAPSADGKAVGALPTLDTASPRGRGVAASSSKSAPDFGALAGKVASICQAGDLMCDIDPASGTAKAVDDVAGTDGDPVAAMQQITGSLLSSASATQSQGGTGGGLLASIVDALTSRNADLGAFENGARIGYSQPTTSVKPPGSSGPTTAHNWDAVADCESGGDWSKNTGNGYYGGLQFTTGTWIANGGEGLPSEASRDEQIRIAENVLKTQGAGAWPTCGADLGGDVVTTAASDTSTSPSQYVSNWFTAAAKDAAAH